MSTINIYWNKGKIFVFNASDVITLRKDHRIIGSLAGICPNRPFQIQTKWLPLQLMQEEAYLLTEKGIAELVSDSESMANPAFAEFYYKERDRLCEEQIILLKENQKKIILEKADEIYEGKKRKYMQITSEENKKRTKLISETPDNGDDKTSLITNENSKYIDVKIHQDLEIKERGLNFSSDTIANNINSEPLSPCESLKKVNTEILDKQSVIDAEIAKIPNIKKELCMVQLFTECPMKRNLSKITLPLPSSEEHKLRYAVFKDLWEKKYYVTSGLKFGGDFLVYEGDPFKYHSSFIIICIPQSKEFSGIDIVTYGRLGHQVKKTVSLASFNDSGQIDYISINWNEDLF